MAQAPHPVVHLELHTRDLTGACDFYARLCGWSTERIRTCAGSYRSLDPGDGLSGGVVECAAPRPLWLPYVAVPDVTAATERARALGASVLLAPREGPAGWRSVVGGPSGGELAIWQAKE
jgi:predicted enzyme related to lactoylglutathione lyase